MFIVSANYRNRSSSNRWLVRRADQHPREAIPCVAVSMTGVEFVQSDAFEQGFGCNTVARCQTAIPSFALPGTRLTFNGRDFEDEAGQVVDSCEALVLGADGSVLIPPATTTVALAPQHKPVLESA